ncbi:MAG: cytochrome P450 [Verrucomicrobia bacterium]|nr:cytochrome P450 [Verrucomicrobiota bacterium]
MTLSGWVVMILSVGFVTSMLVWCIYLVMKEPEATERLHAQDEIDTRDTE